VSWPRVASSAPVLETVAGWPGVVSAGEAYGEAVIVVERGAVVDTLRRLRDEHQFQQLMCVGGADWPARPDRFEVAWELLSLTANRRVRVKAFAAEGEAMPSVVALWPVAGWFEREVWDLYGVPFEGNPDLRRILTDYGFEGHPFRKDFPLTGFTELRYSEEEKRVVQQPVRLTQEFRDFDFLSPWDGARYVLPGDEKAAEARP
jgi:NADH-quinone oxidoreductase subunit C